MCLIILMTVIPNDATDGHVVWSFAISLDLSVQIGLLITTRACDLKIPVSLCKRKIGEPLLKIHLSLRRVGLDLLTPPVQIYHSCYFCSYVMWSRLLIYSRYTARIYVCTCLECEPAKMETGVQFRRLPYLKNNYTENCLAEKQYERFLL